MERRDRLTVREFEQHPAAVLLALRQGTTLWLMDGAHVIAHLTPVAHQPLRVSLVVSDLMEQMESCELVLGERALSRILNLTPPVFALQRASGNFDRSTLARLSAVAEVLAEQATVLSLARRRKWWQRPHPELNGRTPVEHLGLPWTPESASWRVLMELMRRQYLLKNPDTGP